VDRIIIIIIIILYVYFHEYVNKYMVDVISAFLVAMVKPELATEEERTVAIDLKGLKRASRD
jgi:hypothetical protein